MLYILHIFKIIIDFAQNLYSSAFHSSAFVRVSCTSVVIFPDKFYILHEIFRRTSISVRIQCLTFPLIRDTICMNYDRNRKTTFRRTSDLQIQYFERLNPEMECIYLLERRYQAGEDAPHSIPALRGSDPPDPDSGIQNDIPFLIQSPDALRSVPPAAPPRRGRLSHRGGPQEARSRTYLKAPGPGRR